MNILIVEPHQMPDKPSQKILKGKANTFNFGLWIHFEFSNGDVE